MPERFDAHMKEHIEVSMAFMEDLTTLAMGGLNLMPEDEVEEAFFNAARGMVARALGDGEAQLVECKVESFRQVFTAMRLSIATMEKCMELLEGFDKGEY